MVISWWIGSYLLKCVGILELNVPQILFLLILSESLGHLQQLPIFIFILFYIL